MLVHDITVVKRPGQKVVSLQIRWQGGETETITVAVPPNRPDAVRYPEEFVERIRAFALEHHDEKIASLMTTEDRGRVARPFGFALTDPGRRLSRTRLFPEVTRIVPPAVSKGE
jgi:hypothetical protein